MPPYAADIQRCTSRRCTSSLAGAIPISQRALTETAGPYLENCLLGGCSAALARTSRQRHEWTARLGMLATSLDKGRGRRHWLGEHEKYNNAMDILEKGGGAPPLPSIIHGAGPLDAEMLYSGRNTCSTATRGRLRLRAVPRQQCNRSRSRCLRPLARTG